MRAKSIVSITTIAPTMETFVLESMEYMQQKGWNVTLMCKMDLHLIANIPPEMHYVDIPMERSFSLVKAWRCTWCLVKEFRRIKPAIVQYGTTHAALFGSIAAWITHVPVRIHLQWGIYNYKEMGLSGCFYWFVEWLTCKLSTTVRPVSHKNLDVAIDSKLFKSGKGKVLGEGGTIGVKLSNYPLAKKEEYRNAIRERHQIAKDAYVFGFIGRISKDKGVNELIEAFRKIENESAHLLLIGPDEGTVNAQLKTWAEQCPKVTFTGRVSHEEMPQYISTLDVLVHPTYREGFGMVLQEAMAMQVPIITTNIPGPSEVIEDGKSGMLVPSHDAVALRDAMNTFVHTPGMCEQYGVNGRKRVEQYFDRPRMIENIYIDKEELYSSYKGKVL